MGLNEWKDFLTCFLASIPKPGFTMPGALQKDLSPTPKFTIDLLNFCVN